MLGHLERGDGRQGPQIKWGLVDGFAAPHVNHPHVILVDDGEDPESSHAGQLCRVWTDGQICKTAWQRSGAGGVHYVPVSIYRYRVWGSITGMYPYIEHARTAMVDEPQHLHPVLIGTINLGLSQSAWVSALGYVPYSCRLHDFLCTHLQARQLLLICDTAASLCSPPPLGCCRGDQIVQDSGY